MPGTIRIHTCQTDIREVTPHRRKLQPVAPPTAARPSTDPTGGRGGGSMGSSAQRLKTDSPGRGKKGSPPKDQQFVQLFNGLRAEPAWLALSFGARCLYVELKALYNGHNNNGRLMCSARFAAKVLGCSRTSATGYFRELQEKGFVVETKGGSLGSDGRGQGRMWRLTELGFMGEKPTTDYLDWKPVGTEGVPKTGTVTG